MISTTFNVRIVGIQRAGYKWADDANDELMI
jgi:hypothetical protein